MKGLLDRIIAASGTPDLLEILAERLTPTDLQSLMLEVYARRSAARTPADLLNDYEKSRFFGASPIQPSEVAEWERILRESAAPACEFLILSPVTPLGTCTTIAPVSQSWSVPTARTGEVVSDATNVLAVEAAIRRRETIKCAPKTQNIVHLATTQRVVRPQAYDNPAMLAHFSLSACVSSGRDQGDFRLEAEALKAQVGALLTAYRRWFGSSFRLTISYTIKHPGSPDARLETLKSLAATHDTEIIEDATRSTVSGYYDGFCFHILGGWSGGDICQLADGGSVDWAAKLLSNAKERMMISGTGVEGLVFLRRAKPEG